MSSLIYKYLPNERLTYLDDELLRITQPFELNDPFECFPSYPTIEDMTEVMENVFQAEVLEVRKTNIPEFEKNVYLKSIKEKLDKELTRIKNKEPNTIRETLLQNDIDWVNNHLGVLSLSKRWDNPLMWAHYTNSHRGFCIGFDLESDFFQDNNNDDNHIEKWFVPVEYSDRRIKMPTVRDSFTGYNVLYTKSKDWEYEKEYRILIGLKYSDKVIKTAPTDIFLLKVPHKIVREIVIGLSFPKEKITRIVEFGRAHKIPIYTTRISDYEFLFERNQI